MVVKTVGGVVRTWRDMFDGQDDAMNAEMNTLRFEQKSSLDAVQAKQRELQKIQVGDSGAEGVEKRVLKPERYLGMYLAIWSTYSNSYGGRGGGSGLHALGTRKRPLACRTSRGSHSPPPPAPPLWRRIISTPDISTMEGGKGKDRVTKGQRHLQKLSGSS